ncbi:MAG: response regulator [Leptolyngbyaceae cyanobacterium bins.302]|nr:response regulator [Leptolyngbyaceae cyanobacterium bins.302]
MIRELFDLKRLKQQRKRATGEQIVGIVSFGVAIGVVAVHCYLLMQDSLKAPKPIAGFHLSPFNVVVTAIVSCLVIAAAISWYHQFRYSAVLLQEQQQLRSLIRQAPVAMAFFDREGRILLQSDCWLAEMKFLGESVGNSESGVPDHWKDGHAQAVQGKVTHHAEDPILLKNGTNHWLKWTVQPWYQDGQVGGSVLFVQPIDQLIEARESALETAQTKSQFLANMSHEIRTPMVGVLGSAELLLGDNLTAEQHQFVQIIYSNSQHLLKVINDILDFSKLEAGKLDLDEQWFDLDRCINEVLGVIEHQAFEKLIQLTVHAKGTLPNRLRGDAYRLKQVLFNLLGNAVKFTPCRGQVSLTISADTRQEEAVLRFEITDTGIGIARRDTAKLFRAFSQVDPSYTRQHGGTGLGLAISRQLVKQMGGRIDFKSQLGKGSCFWFTTRFEVGQSEPRLEPVAVIVPVDAVVHPLNILLVEDDPVNQFVMQHHLQRLGHQAEVASTGREALKKLHHQPFDLILMDCQMPRLDGYSTTRIIRRSPQYASLPIIALTAHAQSEERQRCLEAGMNDYLSKPVSQAELGRMLQRWGQSTALIQSDVSVPIDMRQLLESFGERGTVLQVVQKFVKIAQQEIAALDRALMQRDWGAVARFSHRFRGACAVVRSASLTRLTDQLEVLAKQPRPMLVRGRALLEKCRQELLQIESWVQSTNTNLNSKQKVRP